MTEGEEEGTVVISPGVEERNSVGAESNPDTN
jgi:hypothetical protein